MNGQNKLDIKQEGVLGRRKLTNDGLRRGSEAVVAGLLILTGTIVEPEINGTVSEDDESPGIGGSSVVDVPVNDAVESSRNDDPVADNEEVIAVTSGVRVTRVLNRLGGAMLSSQCVVLLTIEK